MMTNEQLWSLAFRRYQQRDVAYGFPPGPFQHEAESGIHAKLERLTQLSDAALRFVGSAEALNMKIGDLYACILREHREVPGTIASEILKEALQTSSGRY